MRSLLVFWLLLASAPAGGESKPDPSEWAIVPGVRVGPVRADTCHAALVEKLGPRRVRVADVPLGEGEIEQGSVLWPDDPTRRLEILWQDRQRRCWPGRVIIRNRARHWRTAEGIGLGTSLKQLERVNTRPFTLSGFGWDYGGTVISWQTGALDGKLKGCDPDCPPDRILVRLAPLPSRIRALARAEHEQVLGDRSISSSHPVMRKLDPRVVGLAVLFTKPEVK
ncbi:MAG: hypothetical protein JXR96_27065 [Deltaproteobacteria bacterium]|nr:hypothetical protein [Deltaproteobacteria bacterium]